MVSFANLGRPAWSGRNYEQFAKEGYQKNAIAYTCISLISGAAKSVPWALYRESGEKREKINDSNINALLDSPAPLKQWPELVEAAVSYRLISGNTYLEAVTLERGVVKELYALRPDRMKVAVGPGGMPAGYVYEDGGQKTAWDVDPITGTSDILHIKKFHPLNHWYGMSPIEAAAYSIDQHNSASSHNQALLQNGVRPSGALIYSPQDSQTLLTEKQYQTVKRELENEYGGPKAAGKPLLLEGAFKWEQMSLSPKDIDWLKGKDLSTTEIGLVYKVPPQMLGIQGSQTFANYEQATLQFWENAVIPELVDLREHLNKWLLPKMGMGIEFKLDFDLESVSALIPLREKKWQRLTEAVKAGLLTINEARKQMGFEATPGGDEIYIPAGQLPLGFDSTDRTRLLNDQNQSV